MAPVCVTALEVRDNSGRWQLLRITDRKETVSSLSVIHASRAGPGISVEARQPCLKTLAWLRLVFLSVRCCHSALTMSAHAILFFS